MLHRLLYSNYDADNKKCFFCPFAATKFTGLTFISPVSTRVTESVCMLISFNLFMKFSGKIGTVEGKLCNQIFPLCFELCLDLRTILRRLALRKLAVGIGEAKVDRTRGHQSQGAVKDPI